MAQMKIGWIGTGVMGKSMASHVLKAGYPLTVYTRTKSKASDLLDLGARWASNPREVAENSDVVFSIVGYPADVEQCLIGSEGAIHGLKANGILCDMTTSSPGLAARIAEEAAKKSCFALDCPVTGGDIGAQKASLSIFAGGDEKALDRIRPILEHMGKKILYCGKAGMGQRGKLANQIAIAGVMFSTCESILFAREAGLPVREWLESVVVGAAGSVAMNTLGRRILDNDAKPGFYIDHFIKDLGLCLDECKKLGIVLPGTSQAEQIYRLLQAEGYGKNGTQFLTGGLARMCGKQWEKV